MLKKITGIDIFTNQSSPRIINIIVKNETINTLLDFFERFDLTAIEYKPFTRFTIAKYLNDLTNNELGSYLNCILRDRDTGCFIISPESLTKETDDNQ